MKAQKHSITSVLLLSSLLVVGCDYATSRNASKPDLAKIASLNTELGFRYMQEGELDLAHKKLTKALDANPRSPEAHNAMGLLKNVLGQNDEAEKSFLNAISLEKSNPATANNYGQFLCQQKKYLEGGKYLLSAAENPLNSNQTAAYYNLGKCLKTGGRTGEAENYFKKALTLSPANGATLIELAHIGLLRKEMALAKHYFNKFIEISDHNAFSLWVGYMLAVETNSPDSAASFRLLLKGMFPGSPEAESVSVSIPIR